MDRPEISPRASTVEKLEQLLEKERVVLVRGTPTSGKTTLGRLLRHHYKHNRINGRIIPVVLFDAWECDGICFTHKITAEGRREYSEFEDRDFVTDGEYLLILDEGQVSYPDYGLWLGLIKTQSWQNFGQSYGPRICILASYGSPGAGPVYHQPGVTLASLTAAQGVSITKSPLQGYPDLALFYDSDEFNDVISRFSDGVGIPNLRLSEKARTRIYELTNGHPGAVNGILNMLLEKYRNELKHHSAELDEDHIQCALDDQEAMQWVWLSSLKPSLPNELSEHVVFTLRKVLAEGWIAFDLEDEGIKTCYERGWLHSEPRDLECEDMETYPTIEDLARAILERFSPRNLSTRIIDGTQTLGPGAAVRTPEAVYQDEFYRASAEVLGYAMDVKSEWSPRGSGRIDFCFGAMKWGIELLREGDRLNEHCGRFMPGGVYSSWIQDNLLLDWIIIDCRTTEPRPYSGDDPSPKLWRTVFQNSFSSVKILDGKNHEIHQFVLTNNS
ncbi:hypothetical protein N7535_006627 [Penicillium sp. DV-2018c]|nr:hypothetical protein N7535_006627 [Penicillium sp. DV-2018c]